VIIGSKNKSALDEGFDSVQLSFNLLFLFHHRCGLRLGDEILDTILPIFQDVTYR
jgi:hypothetical protein